MALSQDKPAPYTSSSVILSLLAKNRATGLPSPIDKEALSRLGVSDSLSPRTLQALNVLDLIDEQGDHTETLKKLRTAPEGEYKERMTEWLNTAYAEVLQYVEPSQGDEVAVRDAFRTYSPQSMLNRMVTLFTGLYGEAGVWPKEAQHTKSERAGRQARSRPTRKMTTPKPPPPEKNSSSGHNTMQNNNHRPPEMKLEYRLVDLMSEAKGDPEVMQAIITIITFLKTKEGEQEHEAKKGG